MDGRYYAESFINKEGLPVELIQLECCGHVKDIPIKKEKEYIQYRSNCYKGQCPICSCNYPPWSWMDMRDIEYICYWED